MSIPQPTRHMALQVYFFSATVELCTSLIAAGSVLSDVSQKLYDKRVDSYYLIQLALL